MIRLKSTRNIFRGKIQTTFTLLVRTDKQLFYEERRLNALRGAILRASKEATLKRQRIKLEELAAEIGYRTSIPWRKEAMLAKIKDYKEKITFLRYAAIDQAVINLCVIYEDFIRRVILKYYEEDIRRLFSEKESMKNKILIEALLRGDNIHRELAKKIVDDLTFGSVDAWHGALKKIGMSMNASAGVHEVFLVRNCIVHNNVRVSTFLHEAMPQKYGLRDQISISTKDVEGFKNIIHKTATFICAEYSRLFPVNGGTWLAQ